MIPCSKQVRVGDQWSGTWRPCGRDSAGTFPNGSPGCALHLQEGQRARRVRDDGRAWIERMDAVKKRLGLVLDGRANPGLRAFVTMIKHRPELLAHSPLAASGADSVTRWEDTLADANAYRESIGLEPV